MKAGLRHADVQRRLVAFTRLVHRPAHPHNHDIRVFIVAVRTFRSKRCDGRPDYVFFQFADCRIADTKSVHIARRERLNDEIGSPDEFTEQLFAVSGLYIEGNALFVRVIGEPVQVFFGVGYVMPETPHIPRRVATRSLDFDYIGTQVGKYLAAQEAFFIGQVQYPAIIKHTSSLLQFC